MKNKWLLFVCLILVILIGCRTNIFSPFHNPDNDTSLSALLSDGNAAFENQDYENAEKYYKKAMEEYPHSGKARLGHSASYVALKGVNTLDLFNDLNLDDDTLADTAPLFDRGKCPLYFDVSSVVDSDLTPIIEGYCNLPTDDSETNLNIAFISILLGALRIYDIDGNGNFNDNYDILYLDREMNVRGFEDYSSLSAGDRDLIANNINDRIDDVVDDINKCTTALNIVIKNLDLDSGDENMLDDINDVASTVAKQIKYYYYQDGIDNDGDGFIDEEIIDGNDNDADGMIDEDSGGHI